MYYKQRVTLLVEVDFNAHSSTPKRSGAQAPGVRRLRPSTRPGPSAAPPSSARGRRYRRIRGRPANLFTHCSVCVCAGHSLGRATTRARGGVAGRGGAKSAGGARRLAGGGLGADGAAALGHRLRGDARFFIAVGGLASSPFFSGDGGSVFGREQHAAAARREWPQMASRIWRGSGYVPGAGAAEGAGPARCGDDAVQAAGADGREAAEAAPREGLGRGSSAVGSPARGGGGSRSRPFRCFRRRKAFFVAVAAKAIFCRRQWRGCSGPWPFRPVRA